MIFPCFYLKAMAAVSPQTILCEIERYHPAGSSVEAATAPSRWDVRRQRGTVRFEIVCKPDCYKRIT